MHKGYRVIDATVLLTGHIPIDTSYANVTTEEVLKEIKKDSLTKSIIESYLLNKKLLIMNPDYKYIKKAIEISVLTGDYRKLSKADLSIIALALYLKSKKIKTVIITDDYSIQNVLAHLKIKTISYFRKIRRIYDWVLVCEKCGAIYPNDYHGEFCEKCGGRIIRKWIRKH